MRNSGIFFVFASLFAASTIPTYAATGDISALKQAGIVGEQSDGYLGVVDKADAATVALIKFVNAQRQSIYQARKFDPNLAENIRILTCYRFNKQLTYNTPYKSSDGIWRVFREGGPPVVLPKGCDRI